MQGRERRALEDDDMNVIQARLEDDRVVVDGRDAVEELRRRGYGDRDEQQDGRYSLYMYEALYLLYTKKVRISKKDGSDADLEFDELVGEALKHDPSILTKFIIYRDLRSRGYVAREGFGFGNDFRVYERGDYNVKPARYVVFGLNEGREVKIDALSRMVEQIGNMGKEPIVAVIERRGEVIYYKVERMRFVELKRVSIDEQVSE
ncbi:MAG: tRNA-intron lyase [Candidatus Nitrosocaldus sp.]|nr:tRNA-intron lyase [Candidatus Nitrosocaldus sp.]MDW8275916.1 tRNA-intron lyase [Candidatus Nitrosocaldus sp.]